MKKYTYEELIKAEAKQVKSINWPGDYAVGRVFTDQEKALAFFEDYGDHGILWIIVIKDDKETERINVRFLESIVWA